MELHQASHLMVARNCRCPSPCEAVTRGSHSENLEALIGEGRLRTDTGSLNLTESEYRSSVRPRRRWDHPRKVGQANAAAAQYALPVTLALVSGWEKWKCYCRPTRKGTRRQALQ